MRQALLLVLLSGGTVGLARGDLDGGVDHTVSAEDCVVRRVDWVEDSPGSSTVTSRTVAGGEVMDAGAGYTFVRVDGSEWL